MAIWREFIGRCAGRGSRGFVADSIAGQRRHGGGGSFGAAGAGFDWAQSRAAWLAVPLFVAAAWPVINLPQVSALLPKAQAGSKNLYLYEDAVSMTHVVEQQDGQRLLLTDLQRMDASTDPTAVFVQSNQARLPLLLHEQPRSVLFLGLGTGISVAGSLPFPDLQRNAVELSQGAIASAATWFEPANHGAMRQTTVERDDVRHFLSATQDKYDVIIGDVFHPDLAGVSSLLSVQQFQRARNRLNEGGLFVQWLALNQFDRESLGVILRSFRRVFPDAQLFLDGMHLALVGPRAEIHRGDRTVAQLAAPACGAAGCGDGGRGRLDLAGALLGADSGERRAGAGRVVAGARISPAARALCGRSGCIFIAARFAANPPRHESRRRLCSACAMATRKFSSAPMGQAN